VDKVYPQIEVAVNHGVNITSTTEELLYPYRRWPELSKKIDELAKKNGVTVLGTGVNPGFVIVSRLNPSRSNGSSMLLLGDCPFRRRSVRE